MRCKISRETILILIRMLNVQLIIIVVPFERDYQLFDQLSGSYVCGESFAKQENLWTVFQQLKFTLWISQICFRFTILRFMLRRKCF